MKTRSQRLRHERAGLPCSPPQHLPTTIQRRPRAPRNKTPGVKPSAIGNSKVTSIEASGSPLRNVHPVPVRSKSSERVSSAGEDELKVPGGVPNTPNFPPSSTVDVPTPSRSITSNTGNVLTASDFRTSSTVATHIAISPVVNIASPKERYSLIYILENPSSEELASVQPINNDSIVSLVMLRDRIPDLLKWIRGHGEPCGHDLLTTSAVSTQVSPSLKNRKLSNQMEITQHAQPHHTEPPTDQEMSQQPAGPDQIEPLDQEMSESDIEIVTDAKYATRRRPRDWHTLPLQILEAAKQPNAKPPRDDQNLPISCEAVDRYAKDGSLQFGLKAVTYTSVDIFPPNPWLVSKGPSKCAAEIVAENPFSIQLNHATSVEHGSDLDCASECNSVQSGSVYAQEPMLEPSVQVPQPALELCPKLCKDDGGLVAGSNPVLFL